MPSKSWKRGQSGNPKGRPQGKGKLAILRDGLAEHLPEVLSTLAQSAKAGDMQACKILLDRVLPPLKAEEMPVVIPNVTGSLFDQANEVLASAKSGEIAITQAAQLIASLTNMIKIFEAEELTKRIDALEKKEWGQPWQ